MEKKGSPVLLIVCIVVMASVCGGLFYLRHAAKEKETASEQGNETAKDKPRVIEERGKPFPEEKEEIDTLKPATFGSTENLIENLQTELLKIESPDDLAALMKDVGIPTVSDEELKALYQRIGKNGEFLERGKGIEEIGEIKRKEHTRYALNLKDGSRIFFDVKKDADGNWVISEILPVDDEGSALDAVLVKGNAAQRDGLIVTHSFVQFAIKQEFLKAKQLVTTNAISDVQLAGLCIIFDESDYRLRNPRGVLTNFNKDTRAGYAVVLETPSKLEAQFSVVLSRDLKEDPWKVSQINFSSLLAKFIEANGGDSYFTPLVKNPQGGDSIVVYFEFNDQGLSARTQRQLKIVANILKLDDKKKITLTGHTDAVGGDDYNKNLSNKRAVAVRDFLSSEGVSNSQITTIGFGSHRPRKANTLSDGSDNPDGRKANRRTEIYLDF